MSGTNVAWRQDERQETRINGGVSVYAYEGDDVIWLRAKPFNLLTPSEADKLIVALSELRA